MRPSPTLVEFLEELFTIDEVPLLRFPDGLEKEFLLFYALPDLTASFVRKQTLGSEVVLTVRVGNGGGNAVGPETVP